MQGLERFLQAVMILSPDQDRNEITAAAELYYQMAADYIGEDPLPDGLLLAAAEDFLAFLQNGGDLFSAVKAGDLSLSFKDGQTAFRKAAAGYRKVRW